jgi:hypothetical protein
MSALFRVCIKSWAEGHDVRVLTVSVGNGPALDDAMTTGEIYDASLRQGDVQERTI